MKRDTTKIIYGFLQGSLFRHSNRSFSCRSSNVITKTVDDEHPKRYITRKIYDNVDSSEVKQLIENHPSYKRAKFSLKKPQKVLYEIFPLSFKCSNCYSVVKFDYNQVKSLNEYDNLNCTDCGEQINEADQMYKVLICSCGNAESIRAPKCCNNPMALDDSQKSLGDAYWYCNHCNNERQLYSTNSVHCSCGGSIDGEKARIVPNSDSRSYYVQTMNLINAHKKLDKEDQISEQVIRKFLQRDSYRELNQTEKRIYNDYKDGATGLAEDLVQRRDSARFELDKIVEIAEANKNKEIKSNISGIGITRLFEYQSMVREDALLHSQEYKIPTDSLIDMDAVSEKKREKYNKLSNEVGIERVNLIDSLPTTELAYGYTRVNADYKGEDTNLKTFKSKDSNKDKEVYINHNKAEAVLIEFSLDRLVGWLEQNGIYIKRNDERGNRDFLIQNSEIPSVDSNEFNEKFAVYNLLHTLSHILMRAIGSVSGYSTHSLSERIYPYAGAVLIYREPDADFNLGAIYSAFQDNYDTILEEHIKRSAMCDRDPVCSSTDEGSCDDCLYVPRFACYNDTRNNNLSRFYLHGGGDIEHGFLDI
jgi:hypothetical protein